MIGGKPMGLGGTLGKMAHTWCGSLLKGAFMSVRFRWMALVGGVSLGFGSAVMAQPDPSGIEFVTVGDVGNANWFGAGDNNGRGAVDYEYKIGKFEVTTAQWVEFMNAAFDRPANDPINFVASPNQWSAVATTPNTSGARRWTVPAGSEVMPVGGITWRTAAIYCNWLHNGKSSLRANFRSGAYDVTTFGGGPTFRDQLTRSAGALYWIPSLDEWMKASHWDPSRNGEGEGGWWTYSNGSESPFVYGPPGALVNGAPANANAGWDIFDFPGSNPFAVPLGAYASETPFGLRDAAGGTTEWTEGIFQEPFEQFPRGRVFEGSTRGETAFPLTDTTGYYRGSNSPSFQDSSFGFRVAAAVPGTGPFGLMVLGFLRYCGRRRANLFNIAKP